MKLLAEITLRSLGLGDWAEHLGGQYESRKSARAILENADGLIALQSITKHNFYKLPGGGIEPSESPEVAVLREVREEVGAGAVIVTPIGMVIEYRATLLHISYAYHCKVEGVIGVPNLESDELADGHETLWVPPDTAVQTILSGAPAALEGRFIIARETAFLTEYLRSKSA